MNGLKKRTIENKKGLPVTLIVVLLIVIAIGFAIISNTFGFLGTANVAKGGIWDIQFENLNVTSGSVATSTPATINVDDTTKINFSIELQKQEDFYEFEVDLSNKGTIDGKVNQIKLESTPVEFSKYLDYTVTYNDGKQIKVNDLLLAGESKRLKIKIKYVDDVDMSDFASDKETLSLSFEIKLVEYVRSGNVNEGKNLIQVLKLDESADVDTGIDFGSVPNKSGLYLKNDTEGSEHPIYYYRGSIENNNVLFADMCWKIVRTTETGGTKLIYSGVATSGKCTGISNDSIGMSDYNSLRKGAIYTGYMFNESSNILDEDDAVNTTDSDVKIVLDEWFNNNLSAFSTMLADESWCNDRATSSTTATVNFAAKTDRGLDGDAPSPSLSSCKRSVDRFSKSNSNGNGKLTNPVGLLTADEAVYAGLNANEGSSYFGDNGFWTMTPTSATSSAARVFVIEGTVLNYTNVTDEYAVRPAIVLRDGVNVSGGNGTLDSPYVIPEMSFEDNKKQSIIQQLKLDESAVSDSSVNFGGVPTNDALYLVNDTKEDEYPIYYYRGNVVNNNLIFANKCWKIVRTTELGGTKLLYNGEPNGGKCDGANYSTIGMSTYNSVRKGALYTGYMFNESSTIQDIDGVVNITDSDVKALIDTWYFNNLNDYTDFLEDEVWCNDRSTESTSATVNFSSIANRMLDDETPVPSLNSCTRTVDKFTTGNRGNGKLSYPIGMLTADEVVMSGYNAVEGSSYLGNSSFWTMTPASANASNARVFMVEDGILSFTNVTDEYGIRPSIVLKVGISVTGGSGMMDSPYKVE